VNRSAALPLLGLVVGGYGIYTALYIPAMFVGPPAPLLLIGFLGQVASALAAAVGLWTDRSWAGVALILLGGSIAATQLFELLLGVVPLARALVVAVVAIVAALLLARWIRTAPRP
jgi:hypothetical protein